MMKLIAITIVMQIPGLLYFIPVRKLNPKGATKMEFLLYLLFFPLIIFSSYIVLFAALVIPFNPESVEKLLFASNAELLEGFKLLFTNEELLPKEVLQGHGMISAFSSIVGLVSAHLITEQYYERKQSVGEEEVK